MYATIIGLVFCLLLGLMIRAQGLWALLWFPLGFVISLYFSAQIILPLILGIPRAIRLEAKRQIRAGVFVRLLIVPALWTVVVFGALFLLGFLWPSVATFVAANSALNVGSWLGIIAIILSPLSKKSRSDFREDFDRAYSRFYTVQEAEIQEAEKWRRGYNALEVGKKHYSEQRTEEALDCFDTAIECGLGDGEAFSLRGSCLQTLEWDLDAIDDFSRAISLEPQDCNHYFQRAMCKTSVGDHEGFLADIQEAIRLSKTDNALNRIYNTYAQDKGWQSVTAMYEGQAALSGDMPDFVRDRRIERTKLRGRRKNMPQ